MEGHIIYNYIFMNERRRLVFNPATVVDTTTLDIEQNYNDLSIIIDIIIHRNCVT